MRHLFSVLCLLSALVLGSCHEADDEDCGVAPLSVSDVRIRLSAIGQLPFPETSPATRATDVARLCGKLCVAVYRDGRLDTLAMRQSSGGSFGDISLRLRNGNCRLLVFAHSSARDPGMDNPEKISFGQQNMSDVLYWTDNLSVVRDTLLDISMRRAVARVDVVTTDTIPPDVGSMYFIITKGSYIFNALTGYGVYSGRDYKSIAIPDSLAHKPGTFSFYTFPTADEVSASVTLRAMRTGNTGIYCSRDFKDVPLRRNTVTRLSGVFFKKK